MFLHSAHTFVLVIFATSVNLGLTRVNRVQLADKNNFSAEKCTPTLNRTYSQETPESAICVQNLMIH